MSLSESYTPSREVKPRFFKNASLRNNHNIFATPQAIKPHMLIMRIRAGVERTHALYSTPYAESLVRWAERSKFGPITPPLIRYFAKTESAHRAIEAAQEQFAEAMTTLGERKSESDERYFTTRQIATLFCLSQFTVGEWARTGELPYLRDDNSNYQFPEKSLTDFYEWQLPEQYNPDAELRML